MATNKMLIDAAHPEETRVVVLRGNKVEEFDFEAAERQQLRGNIYLAKVTRVEPSLQAAFIEYGGNRHGFLAFSEIHPDYYQIPVADRLALLEEQAREDAEDDEDDDDAAEDRAPAKAKSGRRKGKSADDGKMSADSDGTEGTVQEATSEPEADENTSEEAGAEAEDRAVEAVDEDGENATDGTDEESPDEPSSVMPAEIPVERVSAPVPDTEEPAQPDESSATDDQDKTAADDTADDTVAAPDGDVDPEADNPEARRDSDDETDDDDDDAAADDVEDVGGDDALEEVPQRRKPRPRQYKIQEVIKRRQVLLVQVVKEERGNKGAALTTYLSLAGRYSVLMPNTARGGGISRKITNVADRKRLKSIAQELEVPEGMGVILRTAGASRTKAEIKRDFEYLLRLWENIRDLTLKSTAPNLVYEEGSLVKRSIRDLYSKEVDEVLVAGEDAYREAKDFMRMLMPSHARNVQPYKNNVPIFSRYSVEPQLDAMFSPQVTLKSGGYIVINQTEALVAIDVNSGRSTREHSIENTALQTNLEAAEEAARQLRLRDLAGLIVIDFIDMEEKRNNRSVERKLKECLKADRARIQVGRISHFGLLEMSRQRIRTGVLESSTEQCNICHGTGQVRSVSSLALQILRALEDNLLRSAKHHLRVCTRADVALYVLNQKREHLGQLEQRFGLSIEVLADPPETGDAFTIERGEVVTGSRPAPVSAVAMLDVAETDEAAVEDEESPKKRKRRRRKRRDEDEQTQDEAVQADADADDGERDVSAESTEDETESGEPRKRRRRGRRGGRRRRRTEETSGSEAETGDDGEQDELAAESGSAAETAPEPQSADEPSREPPQNEENKPDFAAEPASLATTEPKGNGRPGEAAEPILTDPSSIGPDDAPEQDGSGAEKPKRVGWWQRRSFF